MKDNYPVFTQLVKDQFEYGGKKYSHSTEKEATDILFDTFGQNWLFGTMAKYCFRYKNVARERDLLKIACYMYILWLKRGFHLHIEGVETPIDTNVKIKSENFDYFIQQMEFDKVIFEKEEKPVDEILAELASWNSAKWKTISDSDLFSVFLLCYQEWEDKFSQKAGQDADTYNESNKSK